METKYKSLQVSLIIKGIIRIFQQKYENLKRETIDLKAKIEYFKRRQDYEDKKIDFLKNVYKRLVNLCLLIGLNIYYQCETYDVPLLDDGFGSEEDEATLYPGSKAMKKQHLGQKGIGDNKKIRKQTIIGYF